MIIERTGEGWAVYVEPNELEIRAGQFYPHRALVGFINHRGTLRTSRPVHAPRNWSQLARYKLEDARDELHRRGELRNVAEEKRRTREEREGSFIVKLSDGRSSRFHSMRREPGFGRAGSMASGGAMEWAEEQLKKPDMRWAEFWREGQREPFSVLVKNEHGRITYGNVHERRDATRRRSRDGSLYEDLRAAGLPLDHHESDLYVEESPEALHILKRHHARYTRFRDNRTGRPWLDVPFAYEPFWKTRAGRDRLRRGGRR